MSKSPRIALVAIATLAIAAAAAHAQSPPDSTLPAAPVLRADWLSDRVPLRVGDLLTIVVDEQTAANERVSKVASGDRSQSANVVLGLDDGDPVLGPAKFGSQFDSRTRDIGEAGRRGDLTAVLSVRVVGFDPNGLVRIQGTRTVTVDKRPQVISLAGVIRSQDVGFDNQLLSSRIAEAVITYNGKTIGPRTGILGKILQMLWP